jgi:hypothetical protein
VNCPGSQSSCQNGQCQPTCTVCTSGCRFTSVQAAINAAHAGDTITVCPGRYTETLTISTNLTLAGSDAANPAAVGGAGGNSVVIVQEGVTATIQSMVFGLGIGFLGPGARLGGGLINFGDLTLINVNVEENTADQGGGIYTFGPLTLDNCDILSNRANDAGGGIYVNQGPVTVTNGSLISSNTAAHQGGGILNEGRATVSGGSQVEGNTAGSDGGGIYNGGALTLDASFVQENTATGNGGGILNGDTVTVQNSTVINHNTAKNGGGVYNAGIPPGKQPVLKVIDSAVTKNVASEVGGGIFNDDGIVTMQAGTVINNTATATGGGLFNTDGGTVTFDAESAVVENTPNNCVGMPTCPA